MDFFAPTRKLEKSVYKVAPKFKICRSKDLMIRGGDFFAIWDEENERWSRDQDDVIRIVDRETDIFIKEHQKEDETYRPQYMWDSDSGVIDKWNKYVQRQMRDNYHPLDNKVIFSNTPVKREDYSTHKLSYPLERGPIPAYEELMSTLYSPDERKKIEWAIGSIVAGDSVWIQKFIVLVGDPGTGKSTVLKIIRMLFDGYCSTIDAKALGNAHASFALEPLKNDPLVAMQDDVDLSKLNDNTRLNSIVSHEPLTVNEKFKSQYENTFHCFIFLGSNNDVKITDSGSGLIRRLIDVEPTGEKLPVERYREIMKQIKFELSGIAYHCLSVYNRNKDKYDNYIPVRMLRNTNIVYNFLEENWDNILKGKDGVRYQDIWNAYQLYCDMSKIQYPHDRQELRREIRPYFREYFPQFEYEPGKNCNGYFRGFRYEKFGISNTEKEEAKDYIPELPDWLELSSTTSLLDDLAREEKWPAQYASENETPINKWANVKTTLDDILTNKLHYLRVPEYLIVIDFDIRGEDGEKNRKANLEAAKHFPPTYAEYSKSGNGLHLHYIYKGDISKLSRIYDEGIEIKVFTGNSSLRRKLIGCNDIPIATITGGLPLKGEDKKVIDKEGLKNERALRTLIKRNLDKEYHNATAPSVQFIFKALEDAYNREDFSYDVTDLMQAVMIFATNSTHQADTCLKLVNKMHFKSRDNEEAEARMNEVVENDSDKPIAIYDIEVFPNLYLLCYKEYHTNNRMALFNPTPSQIEDFYARYRAVGFNDRGYDAHMNYGRMMGYSESQSFKQSQKIINSEKGFKGDDGHFSEAYRLDYLDLYDISVKKQSLKKWEYELGIKHLENQYPWDEPLPEDKWEEVKTYCFNDVDATEALFDKIHADIKARMLLSDLSGLPPIDTNRQHITKIIFGNDKKPNLLYTDLATGKQTYMDGTVEPTRTDIIMSFPGYEFNPNGIDPTRYKEAPTSGKSIYMGCDPSEGGYVYSDPGCYIGKCFDVGGMHPASAIAMKKFGEYTRLYKEIRDARIFIKHGDYESAAKCLDGKLAKYLTDEAEAKDLSKALKLILNSTYGFCSATFANPFKDPRDVDNIVAKRGALFMITLKEKVLEMGYDVFHCKTDSIKVANPDKHIEDFIFDFGRKYGYEFEIEDDFDRICLINRAVYIAKTVDGEWHATGKEFAVPYVFKTLFTKEPLVFDDYCTTFSVTGKLYLDMNVGLPDDEHNYMFVGKVGQFIPVREDCGVGGDLLRQSDDGKYAFAAGAKGYKWLEAEVVRTNHLEEYIDMSYFRKLADDAIAEIEKYCDFDTFVNGSQAELLSTIVPF